jgi:hypothetical protein
VKQADPARKRANDDLVKLPVQHPDDERPTKKPEWRRQNIGSAYLALMRLGPAKGTRLSALADNNQT